MTTTPRTNGHFMTLLALASSSRAECNGCAKKEGTDLLSMFSPLTLETNQRMLKYCHNSEEDNSGLYNHQETVVSMPLTSLICEVRLEINQDDI